MVIGGASGLSEVFSTVEIMVQGTWSYAASLPSPRGGSQAVTLANSVFVFGKYFILFSFHPAFYLTV